MNGTSITASEITKIIKACGENNVTSFEFEGMKISFDTPKSPHKRQIDFEIDALDVDDTDEEIPFVEMSDEEIENEADEELLEITDPARAFELEEKRLHGDNSNFERTKRK